MISCPGRRSLPMGLLASSLTLFAACQPHSSDQAMEVVRLRLDTPAAGWKAKPIEAWELEDRILCLFELTPPQGMAAQVITPVDAALKIPSSPKPKRIAILGKTWNWGDREDIDFAKDLASFRAALSSNAKPLVIVVPAPNEE